MFKTFIYLTSIDFLIHVSTKQNLVIIFYIVTDVFLDSIIAYIVITSLYD